MHQAVLNPPVLPATAAPQRLCRSPRHARGVHGNRRHPNERIAAPIKSASASTYRRLHSHGRAQPSSSLRACHDPSRPFAARLWAYTSLAASSSSSRCHGFPRGQGIVSRRTLASLPCFTGLLRTVRWGLVQAFMHAIYRNCGCPVLNGRLGSIVSIASCLHEQQAAAATSIPMRPRTFCGSSHSSNSKGPSGPGRSSCGLAPTAARGFWRPRDTGKHRPSNLQCVCSGRAGSL